MNARLKAIFEDRVQNKMTYSELAMKYGVSRTRAEQLFKQAKTIMELFDKEQRKRPKRFSFEGKRFERQAREAGFHDFEVATADFRFRLERFAEIIARETREQLKQQRKSATDNLFEFCGSAWAQGHGNLPHMKLSDDVGGLTLVARWMKTSLLTDVPYDMPTSEAVLGPLDKLKT